MKKLIRFIEPSFTVTNPSTNGLVGVAKHLADKGWDIEVWCRSIDPSLEGKVRVKHIPSLPAPAIIRVFIDFVFIHLMAMADAIRGNPRPHKTITTGFLLMSADFATVHFSHFNWLGQLLHAGITSSREAFFSFLKSLPGFLTEIIFFYNPWPTRLLPVSEAVADDLRAWAAPWKKVHVLPNCFHGDRFSTAARTRHRADARKSMGFRDDDILLAFASNGHYFRKGLAEAVFVTGLLRQRGHRVNLLVFGGHERTLRHQQLLLRDTQPGFESWTRFTGSVADMPYHLSAADAFFFPSRCEAFSLVEIEAAALGLPLFLTAHHGSEMILSDGCNGRLLPWDITGMADIIESEIRKGLRPIDPPDTGKAFSESQYTEAWISMLS